MGHAGEHIQEGQRVNVASPSLDKNVFLVVITQKNYTYLLFSVNTPCCITGETCDCLSL